MSAQSELLKLGAKVAKESGKKAGKDMRFLHNTTPQAIRRYKKMGGLPVPSLAVTKDSVPFETYGDITLVGKPDLFDPKIAANKMYSSDAYTVRAPRPVRKAYSKAGRKFQDEIAPEIKALGGYSDELESYIWDLQSKSNLDENAFGKVQRFFDDSVEADALFLKEQGVTIPKGENGRLDYQKIKELVNKTPEERATWAQNKLDEYFEPQEYFITNPDRDYYTQRPRLKEYTAENVTNWMKRKGGVGQEGGMASTGMGAQRASTAEPIKSLEAARKRKGDLLPREEAAELLKANEDRFFALSDDLRSSYQYDANSFRYLDEFSEAVQLAGTKGGSESAIRSAFKEVGFDLDADQVVEVKDYLSALRSSPVEYFESKPTRAVGLNEFGAAIVPENTPKDVLDALASEGIRVETYRNSAERLEARKKLKDLAFSFVPVSVGVGALAAGSNEAQAATMAEGPNAAQQAFLQQLQAQQQQTPPPQPEEPNEAQMAFLQQLQVQQQPKQAPSPRMARAQALRGQQDAELMKLRQQSQVSGIPLARDLPEIGAADEMNALNVPSFLASAGTLFTFDDEEAANIVKKQLGGDVVKDAEGNWIARLPSGDYAINKPGVSGQDIAKFGATGGAFGKTTQLAYQGLKPAGLAAKAGVEALAGAGTQAAIEAGQAGLGGEFDSNEVLLAGAATPALMGAGRGAKGVGGYLKRKFGPATPRIIDEATGLPTAAMQAALDENNLPFSSLVDDVDNLPAVRADETMGQYVKRVKRLKLERGDRDEALAPFRLEGGKVVNDDLAEQAIKQGYEPRDVQVVKTSNAATRKRQKEMLDAKRKIRSNRSAENELVPLDIAGDELYQRVKYIKGQTNAARERLNQIAARDLPGKAIDTRGVEASFLSSLNDLDIKMPPEVEGNTRLLVDLVNQKGFFKGSAISKDPAAKKVIRDVLELLDEAQSDALGAHKLKRQLDTLIDYKSKKPGALTPSGQKFAKKVRAALNDSIRAVSDDYAQVNDKLSAGLKTMQRLQEAVPRKVDLMGDSLTEGGKASATGQELRKLQTHYASRQELTEAVKQVEDTARNFGGKFDVNIEDLVTFDAVLENRHGASRTRTFKGQIEQAGINIMRPTDSAIEFLERKVTSKIGEKFGPDEEKAFNAMQRILMRND